jgi:hypothetical protein
VAFYLFGIAVAIGCAFLLFELGTMLESRAVGLTAAMALLFMGFAPGIFNYVFPYGYAATLGLMLSLLCAWSAVRQALGRPGFNLLVAGMTASLAMLCKQEFGVASYLMLAFLLIVESILQRSMRPLLRGIVACTPGVVLWGAIYGWFFWTLTPAFMIHANWIGTPGTYFMQTYGAHLYSAIGQRFIPREMIALTMWAGVCLMLWFLLARMSRGPSIVAIAILVAIACADRFGYLDTATKVITIFLVFPIGMFFVGCGFVAYSSYELLKSDRKRMAEVAFGVFALFLSVRVLARVAPYGYSIYYAMPLFLVFTITIARCIQAAVPTMTDERRRMLVNSLLAVEIVMLALIAIPWGDVRTSRLETNWGEMYLTPEDARTARQIIDFMSEQGRLGRQVDVVPEAPMLYAFAGTEAPSRWFTLLPGLLSPSQEDNYISDLRRTDPAYIAVTARNTSEHGAPYFGVDYNQKILRWIEANYVVDREFGRFRRDGSRVFVAQLYRRRDLSEPANDKAVEIDSTRAKQ